VRVTDALTRSGPSSEVVAFLCCRQSQVIQAVHTVISLFQRGEGWGWEVKLLQGNVWQ